MPAAIIPSATKAAGLSGLLLMMAACGSDKMQPTVTLPLDAPDGVGDLLTDFVEVCSLAMIDRDKAVAALPARGWEADLSQLAEQASFGSYGAEKDGMSVQIIPIEFPHVAGTMCMIVGYGYDPEQHPNLEDLNLIEGFLGGLKPISGPDGLSSSGRWSAVAPSGRPITVQVNTRKTDFFNIIMTTSRPVNPARADKE